MKELAHLAFSPLHFPFTLLLLVILLYWLTVIIGVMDFHFLHFNVDADVDLSPNIQPDLHPSIHSGHDVHLDKNIHVDVKPRSNIWTVILAYFNLGKVPFMIFLSFLTLFLWSGNLLGNYYLGNETLGWALLLLIPNLIVSLFLTKWMTGPLISVFSDGQNEFETNRDIIGKIGTVLISASYSKAGQAEVQVKSGAPLLVIIRTVEGQILKRGEKGLIIDYDQPTQTFIIEPYND